MIAPLLAALTMSGAAAAQEAPPPAPTGTTVDGPISPTVIARGQLIAASLGLEPSGEPVVGAVTPKGEAILSMPMRLVDEGRLAGDIATGTYRMSAGAPVVHRLFRPTGADQADAIEAWCGPGETHGFGWNAATVCMVNTPDGKANLGVPIYMYAPWWTVDGITFPEPDARTERVAVESPTTPSVFRIAFIYERLRDTGVAIHGTVEGPGLTADARPYNRNLPREILPLRNGLAEYTYDGLKLTLTPQQRGDVVAVTAERVAPPVDLAARRLRAEVLRSQAAALTAAAAAVDGPARQGVEPTPFVIGALKLDPATLAVGEGELSRGGVVLSGRADYALTARLPRPVTLRSPPLVNDTTPDGLVLHQVEFSGVLPVGGRVMTRIWCGPLGRPTVFGNGQRVSMCLRRTPGGGWEAFWPSTGRPWLGTTQRSATISSLQASDVEIAPSPTSLLEPLGVRFEIQRISDAEITLRVFARLKGEDALIFTASEAFEEGRAVVPLWSHRLVLTRTANGVTATLAKDGDGKGPTDDGFYP
ncbi:MAG: hypothetical protein EBR82_02515 [Caulobacteraceae bacterium]|nr:hypothetical protein [Caulobacteraceae bacterium]